jgi:hypothetical protein
VKREDLEAFVGRDRASVAATKAAHWRERKTGQDAAQILADGDALRRHAEAMRPGWPSAGDRAEDIAVHRRVAEVLRAVTKRAR